MIEKILTLNDSIKKFDKINHQDESMKKFLYQFQDKKNVGLLVKIISKQLDDIEDALADLNDNRGLDSANGEQLDVIGIYKNVARLGQNDEEYRQSIKNQIVLDSSNGSNESFISCAKIIFKKDIFFLKEKCAHLDIYLPNDICSKTQQNVLTKCVPIGVSLGVVYCEKTPFIFEGSTDVEGKGFGSIYDFDDCGYFASYIGDIE